MDELRPPADTAPVLLGIAGWSYADWRGVVYPERPPRGFDALGWLSAFVDLVEVNVTFYRTPRADRARDWLARTEGRRTRFAAKLPSPLTHERRSLDALPAFLDFVAPLRDSGRLEAVLAQFPWSFRAADASVEWIARLSETLGDLPLVLELRHASWSRPPWSAALAAGGSSVAHVDQPRLRDCTDLGFGAGSLAYVRLHGRNARAWFDPDAGRDERYDYDYPPEEIAEIASAVRRLARERERVAVVTNNHFEGQALADLFELAVALGRAVEEIPEGLDRRRPGLRARLEEASGRPVRLRRPRSHPSSPPSLFGD